MNKRKGVLKLNKQSFNRTYLYVPGSSVKMINKALDLETDSIILDLEDAVAPSDKEEARNTVVKYISKIKDSGKEVIVRINSIREEHGYFDLEAIVSEEPNRIIVPEADESIVQEIDLLLNSAEVRHGVKKGKIRLIPLLETASGIMNSYKILSSTDRITGVQLGAEDLTKELEIERTPTGNEIDYARVMTVYAGKSLNLDVIDTPYVYIKDDEGLKLDTVKAKSMGFTAKTCIHPNQINIINEIFTPTKEEVNSAKDLLSEYEKAKEKRKSVFVYNGQMVDAPIIERSRLIIEKYNKIRK